MHNNAFGEVNSGLKGLSSLGNLKAESLSWLSGASVLKVVYRRRHFLKSLACLECLRWLPFHLQRDRTFHDINEPASVMRVLARLRARRNTGNPHICFRS